MNFTREKTQTYSEATANYNPNTSFPTDWNDVVANDNSTTVAVEMSNAINNYRNVDTKLALANSVANFEQVNAAPVVNMNPNNEGEPFILVTQDPLEAVEPNAKIEVVYDKDGNITVRPTPPATNPEADKEKMKKYITIAAIGLAVVVIAVIIYKKMK